MAAAKVGIFTLQRLEELFALLMRTSAYGPEVRQEIEQRLNEIAPLLDSSRQRREYVEIALQKIIEDVFGDLVRRADLSSDERSDLLAELRRSSKRELDGIFGPKVKDNLHPRIR